jgi:FKBP-type peptidyl-prolyl cis-trans isomerase
MKKLLATSVLLFFIALSVDSCAQDMKVVKAKGLRTFNDSLSYAVGQDIYSNFQRQGVDFNIDKVSQALQNAAKGEVYFTQEQIESLMVRYQNQMNEKMKKDCEANIAAGKAYMEKIRNNKSVYTTESGLSYIRKKAGNGKKPTATDKVKVHYVGKLIDGKVFDSSVERGEPITFALNQVIAGWTEGLQLMDEGSKYILYIPHNLAYGERKVGDIPAGSLLVFEVELLEINPK